MTHRLPQTVATDRGRGVAAGSGLGKVDETSGPTKDVRGNALTRNYVIAMAKNAVLERYAEPAMLVTRARTWRSERTEHVYTETNEYQAGTWNHARRDYRRRWRSFWPTKKQRLQAPEQARRRRIRVRRCRASARHRGPPGSLIRSLSLRPACGQMDPGVQEGSLRPDGNIDVVHGLHIARASAAKSSTIRSGWCGESPNGRRRRSMNAVRIP